MVAGEGTNDVRMAAGRSHGLIGGHVQQYKVFYVAQIYYVIPS